MYDASREFKPFAKTDTNHKADRQAKSRLNNFEDSLRARRQAKERREGPNVRIRTGNANTTGYSYVRLRDGVIVGGVGSK